MRGVHCILCCLTAFIRQKTNAFTLRPSMQQSHKFRIDMKSHTDDEDRPTVNHHNRREALVAGFSTVTALTSVATESTNAFPFFQDPENSPYQPAKRPTSYRVDSTIPPTLLQVASERNTLINLGKGSGTDKTAIVIDTVNLNNILNKIVYGSINAVKSLTNSVKENNGPAAASFVCLGVNAATSEVDVRLANKLIATLVEPRKQKATALGLAWCPLSAQSALDNFTSGGDVSVLSNALLESGVSQKSIDLYVPLLEQAKNLSLDLLALSPLPKDIEAVRSGGLQDVNTERRAAYVVDTQGFIDMTGEPVFKMYTDRSLMKDFDGKGNQSNYFSERILVHETAATIAAKYAMQRPELLVILVAPTRDLRYMNGINGRIPRICSLLNKDSKVNNNLVTTILLNPTAEDTLSLTKHLRLEIGTGPETIDLQQKIADYLWFSSSPKVNLIPRLMEGTG
jgi:hypothetical protein